MLCRLGDLHPSSRWCIVIVRRHGAPIRRREYVGPMGPRMTKGSVEERATQLEATVHSIVGALAGPPPRRKAQTSGVGVALATEREAILGALRGGWSVYAIARLIHARGGGYSLDSLKRGITRLAIDAGLRPARGRRAATAQPTPPKPTTIPPRAKPTTTTSTIDAFSRAQRRP